MAKFVFGMNLSLDGYVDHMAMRPGPALFRHWIEHVRGLTGSVYGRRMYEIMRYWDDDRPEWGAEEQAFAAAWRSQPINASVEPNLTRSVKWAQAALMDRRTSDRNCFRQVRHHDWRGLMSTLEAETEIKNTVQATEAVEIIDCGRASDLGSKMILASSRELRRVNNSSNSSFSKR